MENINIEILNPKARKLLNNLAELNLIKIKTEDDSDFFNVLKRIRAKNDDSISLEEITKEVESVRSSRNAT